MKKIYLIATIIALITGLAVFMFASRLQEKADRSTHEDMVEVVVAAADIPQNSTITEDMLTLAYYPINTVPQSVVTNPASVVGKLARFPLSKGEQFLLSKVMVIGDEENEELAERIKSGHRAFTITVDNTNGIAGHLRVGDRIDIIITRQEEDESITAYCLQNISVIAIGNSVPNQKPNNPVLEYGSITLEVTAEDCLLLQSNIMNGLMRIVLRGFGDEEIMTAAVISE